MKKVLIVNRGEIAVRISRTLQQMGLCACTVFSDSDRQALHVRECDQAYHLPGDSPLETYLNQDLILEIARRHNIDAIHPGYGFLSENSGFARRCIDNGISFVGPTPQVIHKMGDKLEAKKTLAAAGVPMVPSFNPAAESSPDDLAAGANQVGYPLLVKAAAGGGGKGMRRVNSAAELKEAVAMARREAANAFGDSRVFLERYLERPRHIEIQIFGDSHGNVVHLGERECSIQRRYQKIIEESPSPALSPRLRAEMGEAACRGARAIGYSNAGTVEFLVDSEGNYFFLEVNTRLQVEHPITEMVYGQDLVRTQMLVAQGHPLPFRQEDLVPRGWALECRLYAEDPYQGFMPATGTLEVFRPPSGPGIRLDSGVCQGSEVSIHYDPMLAKLVTWGSHREEARQRMDWALARFALLGVRNNLHFLRQVINHPLFVAGDTHTHFLTEQAAKLVAPSNEVPEEVLLLAAGFLASSRIGGAASPPRLQGTVTANPTGPWNDIGPWRLGQ